MNSDELRIARDLAGSWDMRFTLTQSPSLVVDASTSPKEIRGKVDLMPNSSLNRKFAGVGLPTNYGSYDVDLREFGFDPRVDGVPPTVVAGMLSADSVAIALSPGNSAARMFMTGRLENDSISGTWHVALERSAGYGRFVLRRSSSFR